MSDPTYGQLWPSIPRLNPDLFDRPLTDREFQQLAAMPNVSPSLLSARAISVQAHIRENPRDYDPPPSCKLGIAYLFYATGGYRRDWDPVGTLGAKDWKEQPSTGDYVLTWLANAPPLSGVRRELAQLEFRWPNLTREARTQALLDFAQVYVPWPSGGGELIRVCAVQIGPAKRTQLQ